MTTPPPPTAADPLRRRLGDVRLYLVTDAAASPARTLEVVAASIAGGVDVVQLRRKGDDALEQFRLAERCRAVCSEAGVLFLVNDRLDIAMAVDADGVHLGQDDLPVAVARSLWPGRIVGRSTHAPDQAVGAVAEGADYLGVGPVWATPTKPGRPAAGLHYVRWAASSVSIPWVAIGGIDADNVAEVTGAGAHAVAVVRAIGDAPDPAAVARRLGDLIRLAGATA